NFSQMSDIILQNIRRMLTQVACLVILVVCVVCHNTNAQTFSPPEQSGMIWMFSAKPADTLYIKKVYQQARKLLVYAPDSAAMLSQHGLAVSRGLNYAYGEALHLLNLAQIERQRSHPDVALVWLRQAAPVCRKVNREDLWGNYYLFGAQI